jgi:hypothetical protein
VCALRVLSLSLSPFPGEREGEEAQITLSPHFTPHRTKRKGEEEKKNKREKTLFL